MKIAALLLLAGIAAFGQPYPLEELIATARGGAGAPGLKDRITKTLGGRGGVAVWGQDYLFVAAAPAQVTISIGHVEVRAAPVSPPARRPAFRPRVTLDEYLRRSGDSR